MFAMKNAEPEPSCQQVRLRSHHIFTPKENSGNSLSLSSVFQDWGYLYNAFLDVDIEGGCRDVAQATNAQITETNRQGATWPG